MNRWPLVAFYVLATLQMPIGHFTGLPLHWAAWALCMVVVLAEAELAKTPACLFFMGYLAMLVLVAVHSTETIPLGSVSLASMSYLLMPLIFCCALIRDTRDKIRLIAKTNTALAVLVAAGAAYQLYVDPILFGLYADTSYEHIGRWAIPRASSLMGSPQVLSAYMAFSVIMFDAFGRTGRRRDFVVFVVTLVGALLSGSVAAIAAIGGYFVVKSMVARPFMLVLWPVVGGLGFCVLWAVRTFGGIDPRSPVSRVLSIVDGGLGNSERIDRWLHAIDLTPFWWGNGIGSASTLVEGADRFNTESYFLNIYYEGGIVLLAGFCLILLRAASTHVPGMNASKWGFLAAFVLTATVVHAFYATALPVVWVLLFGFIALGLPRSVVEAPATGDVATGLG